MSKTKISSALLALEARPFATAAGLQIVAAAYAVAVWLFHLSHRYPLTPPADRLSDLGDTYIGAASAIAIMAGFAGVIVVFIYSAQLDVFVRFRRGAEPQLSKNWKAIVANSLVAVLAFILASLLNVVWGPIPGWCVSIFGFLLAIDLGFRVTRQFFVMLRISNWGDEKPIKKSVH